VMDEGDTRNCKDIKSKKFFSGVAYSRQMKPADGCTESNETIPFVEIELRVRNELKT